METGLVNQKDDIKVEILSTKLIKPCLPSDHLQSYKLSSFDQLADGEHVPMVLFYSNNSIISMTHERLEHSLSKVLTHVYPAAGRFAEDGCSVRCLDQGVPYTRAKVISCKLDDFLEKARNNHLDLAAAFWPNASKNVDETNYKASPIVAVQVTMFECGGMALSFSASHIVIDGFVAAEFVYEWAKVCALGTPVEKINFLSFDLGNIFPMITSLIKSPDEITPINYRAENIVVKRFVVSEAAILRLRKKCTESGALSFKPSRVVIIAAVLWRALIRASAASNGYLRPCLMCLPLNLRSKIDIPQTKNTMGNFRVDVPIKFIPAAAGDETNMDLQNFITLIKNAMDKIIAFCANASPDEVVPALVKLYNESYEAPEWGGSDDADKVAFASMCRFPVQNIDFGSGNPSLIYFGHKDMQMFWLHDTDCLTGVNVQADLKGSNMELFESDPDIKDLISVGSSN